MVPRGPCCEPGRLQAPNGAGGGLPPTGCGAVGRRAAQVFLPHLRRRPRRASGPHLCFRRRLRHLRTTTKKLLLLKTIFINIYLIILKHYFLQISLIRFIKKFCPKQGFSPWLTADLVIVKFTLHNTNFTVNRKKI